MSSQGIFDQLTNSAVYQQIDTNATPDHTIFQLVLNLTRGNVLGSSVSNVWNIRDHHAPSYDLLMGILNIFTHATDGKSHTASNVTIRARLEVVSEERDPVTGEGVCNGYRFFFYYVSQALYASMRNRHMVIEAGSNGVIDRSVPLNLDDEESVNGEHMDVDSTGDLVRQIADLQVQVERQHSSDVSSSESSEDDDEEGDNNNDVGEGAEGVDFSNIRDKFEKTVFPLGDAIVRSIKEGSLVRGIWHTNAKNSYKSAGTRSTEDRMNDMLIHDSQLYHVTEIGAFYEKFISPYIGSDPLRIDGSTKSEEFFLDINSDDNADLEHPSVKYLDEKNKEKLYYDTRIPYDRNLRTNLDPRAINCYASPFYRFRGTDAMFLHTAAVCKEQKSIYKYATPASFTREGFEQHVDSIPHRILLRELDDLGICDSDFDRYPFPRLVFDIASSAIHPEVFFHASFPFKVGQTIPADMFSATTAGDSNNNYFLRDIPVQIFGDQISDQQRRTVMKLTRAVKNRQIDAEENLRNFSDQVRKELVLSMRIRLNSLRRAVTENTSFITNTNPGSRGYPVTNEQFRKYMGTVKATYLNEISNGSLPQLVAVRFHVEWTGAINNHDSSIANVFYAEQNGDENQTLAQVVESAAVGMDDDDSRSARERRILAHINDVDGEGDTEGESHTRPMVDQDTELEKIDFVYRLRKANLFVHHKIKEEHSAVLADVNADRAENSLPPIDINEWPPYQAAHQTAVVSCCQTFLHNFAKHPAISHGMAAQRDYYRTLPLADKTIEPVDTNIALRPFSMFLADINSLFSDFLGVSHLYSLMTLAYFYRLDTMMQVYEHQECNTHLGLMGETSVGKSFIIDWIAALCPGKGSITAEDITDKALRGNFNNMLICYHEIPERIFSKNPTGGNADSINGMKSKIAKGTSVVVAYHVDPKTGERGYTISFLAIRAVYIFATNSKMGDADPAFMDRFAARGVPRKKYSFAGTSVLERSWAKEALSSMEQNDVVSKHIKLMYYMTRLAQAFAAGCYGEDFLQYISNNLIKQFIKDFKETNGGNSKLSNRGMTRIVRLSNVIGIMFATWVVYATNIYLYNYPTLESTCWEKRNQPDNPNDLSVTKYEDTNLPYSETDIQEKIDQVEFDRSSNSYVRKSTPPLDTHGHLCYTLPNFTWIGKEAVMVSLELSKEEFIELDNDHIFRTIISLSGMGIRPVASLSFRQVTKKIAMSDVMAHDQDDDDDIDTSAMDALHAQAVANSRRKTRNHGTMEEMEMDVNYINIPLDSYDNLVKQLIASFEHIIPSEAQVRMVLGRLRTTMVDMLKLTYDKTTNTLIPDGEDEYQQNAIMHYKSSSKKGGACSIQVSVAYLIDHFKLSLDQVNEGTVDPRLLMTTSGDGVGNPIHPMEPVVTIPFVKTPLPKNGTWTPPTFREIRKVDNLADAQDYCRIHEYDSFISQICRQFEGPFTERSNLPLENETRLYKSLGVPSNPNPVFDYCLHRPVRPYLDYDIYDMRRSRRKKEEQDVGTKHRLMIKTKTKDDKYQAIIAGWHRLSILTLRRLPVSEGGNVLHFEQHNQISKIGGMLNPSRKRRFEDMVNGGMRTRIREADNLHFGKYDPDLVSAMRTVQQNGHFKFPVRLAYKWPLDNDVHPISFAPFTMLHLRFINTIEAKLHRKNKVEYMVYPGYNLLEDIRKRRNIERSRYEVDNSSGEIAILGKKIHEISIDEIDFGSIVGGRQAVDYAPELDTLQDAGFDMPFIDTGALPVPLDIRATVAAPLPLPRQQPSPVVRASSYMEIDDDNSVGEDRYEAPVRHLTKRARKNLLRPSPVTTSAVPQSVLPFGYPSTAMDVDMDADMPPFD